MTILSEANIDWFGVVSAENSRAHRMGKSWAFQKKGIK
jgi:hypothetical protein